MTLDDANKADAELLRRTLAGEEEAYRHLVARHAPEVYALIRGITHDAAATERLWPRAFAAAYRHLDRFDLSRSFRPWLLKLAVDYSFHSVRRGSPGEGAVPAAPSIDRLPLLGRAVLTLRTVLEMRYEEIAETLGVPPETVMDRLRDARSALHPSAASPPDGPADLAVGGSCAGVVHWLDAYFDRQLSRTDHRTMERHLARCGECHEEWEAVQALRLAVTAAAQAAAPGQATLTRLQERFAEEADLARTRQQWRGARARASRRPLPFGMESWPQLILGLLTVIAVAVLVHLAQSRRAETPRISPDPAAPAAVDPADGSSRARPSSLDPLVVWGDGLVRLIAAQPPAPASPRGPSAPPPPARDAFPIHEAAWLLAHERDGALSDSLWMRGWRDEARRRADRAIADADSTAGREALATYYRAVSRAGRLLLPDPAAQARELSADRVRIEDLLRLVRR